MTNDDDTTFLRRGIQRIQDLNQVERLKSFYPLDRIAFAGADALLGSDGILRLNVDGVCVMRVKMAGNPFRFTGPDGQTTNYENPFRFAAPAGHDDGKAKP